MSFLAIGLVAAWCLAVVCQVVSLVMVWENARFNAHRARDGQRHSRQNGPWVEVIVPCKGGDPRLEDNLQRLFEQNYYRYGLTFVVESQEDPGYPIIQGLLDRNLKAANRPLFARVLVAGQATDCGQKVHNLRHAVKHLDNRTFYVVFADADIEVKPKWLGSLIAPAVHSPAAITGYRVMLPDRDSLANRLMHVMNNAVIGAMGKGRYMLVWGGSWLVTRDVLEGSDIPGAWRGTLSDDLVASRALQLAKHKIKFEPNCLVATRFDMSWTEMVEFTRRQLLITRKYLPAYWLGALIATLSVQFAWWSSLAVGCGSLLGWTSSSFLAGAAMTTWIMVSGIHLIKTRYRFRMVHSHLSGETRQLKRLARFEWVAFPLIGLVTLGCFIASAIGNSICWRGISFHIGPGGRVTLLGRQLPPAKTAKVTWPRQRPGRKAA